MKFRIFRTRAKQWRWRLVARNGRVVANSGEAYKRRIDCERSITLVVSTDFRTPVEEVE